MQQRAIWERCVHPNGTFTEFREDGVDQSITDRFEQMVRKHPHRAAVKTTDHELDFSHLNSAANRVAHAILALGDVGDNPVALLFEQGSSMIIAILSVLKSGSCYVPLDTSYPINRLQYILGNSQASIIITNDRNVALARDLIHTGTQMVNVDELEEGLSSEDLSLSIAPNSPAFILYTSGSTGQPKGVIHSHRNMLHETMVYTNLLHICPEDRVSLLESYSFGGGVRNLYGALLNGATLCPFDVKAKGLHRLSEWLGQEQITVYRSVETLFSNFGSTLAAHDQFSHVRVIYLGGEPVFKRDVDLYRKHFSQDCILINGLGSTESLTFLWYLIDRDTPILENNVPVGYPVQDMTTLLLDDSGQEVGVDQIGEMAVKSRYLSLGYWQNPEETNRKYYVHPEEDDQRVYLTGDLGLMRPDGLVIHQGRKDFQVKIRGFRVEVSEIEATLLQHPNIKEAVVVAREGTQGDSQLIAHVIAASEARPTIPELRSKVSSLLPDYMVPSRFIFRNELPLTPSGKVDRTSLKGAGTDRPDLVNALITPRTPLEQELTDIWSEVLDLDIVGINDDFLELGGDSLMAGRIISRAINQYRSDIAISSLFSSSTVADMALAITRDQALHADPQKLERILVEVEQESDQLAAPKDPSGY